MRDFNFFSPYMQIEKQYKGRSIIIATGACVIASIVIGLSIFNVLKIKELEQEINKTQAFITSPDTLSKVQEVNDKKSKLVIMKKYDEAIDKIGLHISKTDIIDRTLMEKIALSFPQEVFINAMTISEDDVQIQGISKDRVHIAELEYNLKQLGIFESVHVSQISNESEGSTNQVYVMKCIYK